MCISQVLHVLQLAEIWVNLFVSCKFRPGKMILDITRDGFGWSRNKHSLQVITSHHNWNLFLVCLNQRTVCQAALSRLAHIEKIESTRCVFLPSITIESAGSASKNLEFSQIPFISHSHFYWMTFQVFNLRYVEWFKKLAKQNQANKRHFYVCKLIFDETFLWAIAAFNRPSIGWRWKFWNSKTKNIHPSVRHDVAKNSVKTW